MPRASENIKRLTNRPAACLILAFTGVGLLDLVQFAQTWPILVTGLLDEPAHLLTAGILLAALRGRRMDLFTGSALAGSVLIDLDHIPLYLGHMATGAGGGRPVTHSFLSAALLLVTSVVTRGTVRKVLSGLALGVCLHFFRDLGTGPGVPLLWPLNAENLRLPYEAYLFLLATLAAIAVARHGRASNQTG